MDAILLGSYSVLGNIFNFWKIEVVLVRFPRWVGALLGLLTRLLFRVGIRWIKDGPLGELIPRQ